MKQGWKYSVGLILKVLVILVLPLLLFRYVDSQPTAIVQDEVDGDTRQIAVVNEDTGIEMDSETVELGLEIPVLLSGQRDYTWTVVNRSAAEQGFSNERYDAIIYVPSDFSDSVMTFKDDTPKKASINYVIQPNLEAKNRQRIHKEMARAKNTINQEMSTIYWSYVSQEIDHIREQFDMILEKEIAFQEAMYSFYTPSSESLANEIDRLKSDLENILGQTNQIGDTSQGNLDAAAEAEQKMIQFTDALESYKEAQQEQQKLMVVAQTENKEAIKAGVESYEEALALHLHSIHDRISGYESPLYNQDDNIKALNASYGLILGELHGSKRGFNNWQANSEREIRSQLLALNRTLLEVYNDHLYWNADESLQVVMNKLKGAQGDEEPITIETPEEPEEGEAINLDELTIQVNTLKGAIDVIKNLLPFIDLDIEVNKPSGENLEKEDEEVENGNDIGEITDSDSDPDPEPTPIDWSHVDNSITNLENTIAMLKENIGTREEAFFNWKNYANDWKKAYEQLLDIKRMVSTKLIDHIVTIQDDILQSNMLSPKEKQRLEEEFFQAYELSSKKVKLLSEYAGSLAVFKAILEQIGNINPILVSELLATEAMQEKINDLLAIDSPIKNQLQGMFQVLLDDGESIGEMKKMEGRFNDLISETNVFLADYEELITLEQEQIVEKLDHMKLNANDITNQIQTVNAQNFEWEESPSLQYLDGQIVFNTQQNTLSNLQHLAELISSLDENQSNITSSTSELQTKVSTVQQQSDELNNRWSVNVASTELVRDDVYDILGNTVVDGQTNPFIYNYLSSPVDVEGQVQGQQGQVAAQTEDRLPPVIMFIIILISGLLIGFISHHYSSASYVVQGGLFLLLNVAVGLIISIYGMNIYNLDNAQAIQWSLFTILLLMLASNVVRAGLFINPFVGWLASIGMIVFFITPLIDIIVPEFQFDNPIADVYMAMQFGTRPAPFWPMAVLVAIILIVSAFIYTIQVLRNKAKEISNDEKAA